MLAQVLSIKHQLPRTEVINESLIPQSNLNANNNLLHVIQCKIWLISKQIKTKNLNFTRTNVLVIIFIIVKLKLHSQNGLLERNKRCI